MTFKQNSTGKLTEAQHTIIKLQDKLRLMQKQDSEFSTVQKDLAKMRDWEEMSTNEFADVNFEELVETKSNKIFKQLGPKGVKIKEPEFRAITVDQLERIIDFVENRLLVEKWVVSRFVPGIAGEPGGFKEVPLADIEKVNL